MRRGKIISTGAYLPERIVGNAELAQSIDTSDDWIQSRTGIKQRHIAAANQSTSDLATLAAKQALAKINLAATELDLIIVATTTPDRTFPAVATMVQHNLGCGQIPAFDIQAVCSGFLYALHTADNFIQTGQYRNVLVIGAETFSRIVDWQDRATAILFGDGAAAVILQAQTIANADTDSGCIGFRLHADGQFHDLLRVDSGPGQSDGRVGKVQMQGKEVFKHAVQILSTVSHEVLTASGFSADAVDWVVPHQANRRIIEASAEKLGLAVDKIILTIENHGNTSAASIPLALHHGYSQGLFRPGQLLLLQALGGGFTWGAGLLRI
jgi:3-oxoacyl-[acyl-carrier-protein] synthase III